MSSGKRVSLKRRTGIPRAALLFSWDFQARAVCHFRFP